jgi:cell division septum initiation protein DivIVA
MQLQKATTEATKITADANAGADALRATVAEQVAAAQREAQRLRSEAATEAEATRTAAEKAAETVIARAREKAETLRGEARREVEALQIRREEIKAEMSRVQGVLDALAGPLPTAPQPRPTEDAKR